MFTENKTLPIAAIKQGIVVDHITAGKALKIIDILKLSSFDGFSMVGLNLPSASMGRKDLIKLEECTLSDEDYDKIVVFSPHVTINIIEDFSIREKMKLELPDRIANLAPCSNQRCITNHEAIGSLFVVSKKGPLNIQMHCHYCRKQFLP